jgi:glycosyltransferase involved in cell wall biosynthesis
MADGASDIGQVIQHPIMSIVMPYFNGSRFLSRIRTIAEICRQQNFELIAVDDGSAGIHHDALISELAVYSDIAHIVLQDNQGPSAARRHGLNHAHGRYVLFLDCDDCLYPCAAHSLGDLLRSNCDLQLITLPEVVTHNECYIPDACTDVQTSKTNPASQVLRRSDMLLAVLTGHWKNKIAPSQLVMTHQLATKYLQPCPLSWAEDIPWLAITVLQARGPCIHFTNGMISRWYGRKSRGQNYSWQQVQALVYEMARVLRNQKFLMRWSITGFVAIRFSVSCFLKYVCNFLGRVR